MTDRPGFSPMDLPGRFEDDPDRDSRLSEGIAAGRAVLPPETETERIRRVALARARGEHGKPMRPERRRKATDRKPRDLEPVNDEIASLAVRYLRDGYTAADVATRLGIARAWCEKTARRLGNPSPVGWCGLCTFEGRMRKPDANSEPVPCPECHPTTQES